MPLPTPHAFGPPSRVSNPTRKLLKIAQQFIRQKYPHIEVPYSFGTVSSHDATTGYSQVTKDGDTFPNKYRYPHVIPYSATTLPAAHDRVVIADGPNGSHILGKLSIH